jgi:membrane protease YdiL (CAAX protease family)
VSSSHWQVGRDLEVAWHAAHRSARAVRCAASLGGQRQARSLGLLLLLAAAGEIAGWASATNDTTPRWLDLRAVHLVAASVGLLVVQPWRSRWSDRACTALAPLLLVESACAAAASRPETLHGAAIVACLATLLVLPALCRSDADAWRLALLDEDADPWRLAFWCTAAVVAAAAAGGIATDDPATTSGVSSFTLVVTLPLVEETLFRGGVQRVMRDVMGPWPAVALSALVFALFHSATFEDSLIDGVVLAFAYERTRSLAWSVLLHAGLGASVVVASWLRAHA